MAKDDAHDTDWRAGVGQPLTKVEIPPLVPATAGDRFAGRIYPVEDCWHATASGPKSDLPSPRCGTRQANRLSVRHGDAPDQAACASRDCKALSADATAAWAASRVFGNSDALVDVCGFVCMLIPIERGSVFPESRRRTYRPDGEGLDNAWHDVDIALGMRLRAVAFSPSESSHALDGRSARVEVDVRPAQRNSFLRAHSGEEHEDEIGNDPSIVVTGHVVQDRIAFGCCQGVG